MLLNVIYVIIGFFVLIKGANLFIDGVSSSAINLKIPKIIIALTIVAFGTSAPELVTGTLCLRTSLVVPSLIPC